MNILLGFVISVILLVVIFLVANQVKLIEESKTMKSRQDGLTRALQLAQGEVQRKSENKNLDIAKEISKIRDNSICYVGLSGKIAVSEMLSRFMEHLGYEVEEKGIKIIKKGAK